MSRLFETIQVRNGKIRNLEYHNRRFNASRRELFGITRQEDLGSLIRIPEDLGSGIFRCRVLYGREIDTIEFIPHRGREVRSLKMVCGDAIDYPLKYADRQALEALFARRGDCDEILIIKNGFVTDTSISNIVFCRSDGSWITPDTYLLKGTMRTFLLETGRIQEVPVRPEDLPGYSAAKMINCMLDLDGSPPIPVNHIFD